MFRSVCFVMVLFASVWGKEELPENVKKIGKSLRDTCSQQYHVPQNLIEDCINGNFPEDNHDLKCFLKCMFEEGKFWNADNTVDVDGILAHFPDDIRPMYEPMFKNCKDIKHEDGCESAFLAHKCYHANAPDLYTLV